MARVTHTELLDDLDGKSAAEETVAFGLDGSSYEIDLSSDHAEKLRTALAKYIEKGRKVAKNGRRGGRAASTRRRSAAIRKWALENGYEVGGRGRFSDELLAAYREATK